MKSLISIHSFGSVAVHVAKMWPRVDLIGRARLISAVINAMTKITQGSAIYDNFTPNIPNPTLKFKAEFTLH